MINQATASPMATNIAIVDDHQQVRRGLHQLLSDEHNLNIVGEAENGREALNILSKSRIDILIADIAMPVMNGFEMLREVRRSYPATKVLMMSSYTNLEFEKKSIEEGAEAFKDKQDLTERLVPEISKIINEMKINKAI